MTLLGRDVGEIDALVTDRYLDSLLAGRALLSEATGAAGEPEGLLEGAVRAVSQRLASDLPRFHPSFRFEERLAIRLAEAAASMRLPLAAGGETQVHELSIRPGGFDPLAVLPDDEALDPLAHPLLLRGAVAASAISLAGAAWLAWRRHGASPMSRAARAAHAMRAPARTVRRGRA
jgi:hypothetical protein